MIMRLVQIFALNETPMQLNTIMNISELVVSKLVQIIQNTQQSMGIEHRQGNTEKNRYGLDAEAGGEMYNEFESAMFALLNGTKAQPKGSKQTGELEIDTVGDILSATQIAFSDPATYNAVKDVYIVLSNSTEGGACYFSKGQFESGHKEICISGPYVIKNMRIGIKRLATLVAHELTHALDYVQSAGRYTSQPEGGHADQAAYLGSQNEVNARYSQVVMELTAKIKNGNLQVNSPQFTTVVNRMMQKYKLNVPDITDIQRRQLLKRLMSQFQL